MNDNPFDCVLSPGDCLLYNSKNSLVDKIICVKTWSPVAHIEIYIGLQSSVASRNGIGVSHYPFRREGLEFVLTPKTVPAMAPAMEWFHRTAQGQKYDWIGLLNFFLAAARGSRDRMFCSEFATRWYRKAQVHAFASHWDADKVAPGNFLMSPAFTLKWRRQKNLLDKI